MTGLTENRHKWSSLEIDDKNCHLLNVADQKYHRVQDSRLELAIKIDLVVRWKILFGKIDRSHHRRQMHDELPQETDKEGRMKDGSQRPDR